MRANESKNRRQFTGRKREGVGIKLLKKKKKSVDSPLLRLTVTYPDPCVSLGQA